MPVPKELLDTSSDRDQAPEPVKHWKLGVFTFSLVFFPLYLTHLKFHSGAAFNFFAGDAFYYLDVARNSRGLSFFTFDGVHATNGFHPLWQFLLVLLAHLSQFSFSNPDSISHFFLLDLSIVSGGYGLLAVFAAKQVRMSWLVPLALCPGLTWFFMSIVDSSYLSSWSYVNGMESGLSLLCFGAALLFFRGGMPEGWKLFAGSFFLGLAVLARLDDVFFLLAFFGYAIWQARPHNRLKAVLAYAVPFLMIAAYMIYNRATVGVYLPVSGAAKAGFALGQNLLRTGYALLPASWDPQSFSQKSAFSYSVWAEAAMRLFQLWFPILVAGGYLAVGKRSRNLRNRPALACLCAGALAKGIYNLIFVGIWSQGSWYYPISIFTCNMVFAVALDNMLGRIPRGRLLPAQSTLRWIAVPAVICLFTWVCFSGMIAHKGQSGMETYKALSHGPQIASDIRSAGARSYLELDDGLISYATGMPGTSALGLATDVEAVKAKREGTYLDLMDRRGIHVIVAIGSYVTGMDNVLQMGRDPGVMLGNIHPSEYARYSIEPGPRDEENEVAIYRIVRKFPVAAATGTQSPRQ